MKKIIIFLKKLEKDTIFWAPNLRIIENEIFKIYLFLTAPPRSTIWFCTSRHFEL
jgi:hypothetical protein